MKMHSFLLLHTTQLIQTADSINKAPNEVERIVAAVIIQDLNTKTHEIDIKGN